MLFLSCFCYAFVYGMSGVAILYEKIYVLYIEIFMDLKIYMCSK